MSTLQKYRTSPLSIILFFALLAVAFFAPVLFSNTWHAPNGVDFVNFNYPNDLFAARSLQQGEIPLWNPYVAAGQPYAADPNIGFFYPLRLLLFLTSFTYQTMFYLAVFHYFLGGLFTYALLRDLDASRWGSLLAGIGFMFCGFLIGQMDHINIIFSSIWMPLTFLLCRRALLQQNWGYAVSSGLTLSLSILGGHQQFALFTGYWCGLWLVFYLIHRRGQDMLRSVGLFGVITAVSLTGAAVQIAPTLEFLQFTNRAVLGIDAASSYSMIALSWIHLIFPHYLGQTDVHGSFFWLTRFYLNEFYVYVGVVILFSALLGSYVWKSWEKRFLATIILLGFFLAAGADTPVFRIAYRWVPGMQWMRVPGRFVFWVDTGLVFLSAFGFDWLLAHLTDKTHKLWKDVIQLLSFGILIGLVMRIIYPLIPRMQVLDGHPFATEITQFRLTDTLTFAGLMGAMLLLVLLPRYRPKLRQWVPILWVALAILDLFRAQQPRHFTTDNALMNFEHPGIIQLWRNDPTLYRVAYLPEAIPDPSHRFVSELRWNVLTGLVHGFPQAVGLPWNPFDLQTFTDYQKAINLDSPFYDFQGVKYLVALKESTLPEKWVQRSIDSPTLTVYENSQMLPRAFMVFASLVEPEPAQALNLIKEGQFDPAQTVLLTAGTPFSGEVGISDVTITEISNNSLALQVESEKPGYLVVSDSFYPGWRAFVNDDEQEILRANYHFRALFLQAGQHTVRFEYRSTAVIYGTLITLITWLAGGLLIFMSRNNKKH